MPPKRVRALTTDNNKPTKTKRSSTPADQNTSFTQNNDDPSDRVTSSAAMKKPLPNWLKSIPTIPKDLETETSEDQKETAEECLPFLLGTYVPKDGAWAFETNEYGLPRLERPKHVKYLKGALGRLPPGFAALDASRPWMLYWCLTGLSIMGEDVSIYRKKYATSLSLRFVICRTSKQHELVISFSTADFVILGHLTIAHSTIATLTPIQNTSGGFGGGQGQDSHLATTYAAVLSLAMVGGEEAFDVIDRKAM